MKKFATFLVFILAVGGFFVWKNGWFLKSQAQEPEEVELVVPEINEKRESAQIEDGDTFTSVVERLGIGYSDALAIVTAAEDVFDFTSIKLGKELTLVSIDDVPQFLEYEPNSEVVIRVDLTNEFQTVESPIEYEIEIRSAEVTVEDSLFVSGVNQGLDELLILKFAEVFAWEIDFATQVHTGDKMEVLYEVRSRNGEDVGVGNVLAGRFTNVGDTSSAFLYADASGESAYYDAEGNSLIRPFLKAPLSFTRITSGYTTSRFHPVTQSYAAHRAIDYGAPIGTPIMSVGDGTVVHAAYTGGYGNFIKIRHNGTYQTHYAHLSEYAVSVGDKVKQGDVIGYVGSTGWSTGPHLHYEVQVNGELVNPLEVEFPKGDPIPEERMEDFYQVRDQLNGQF